ncbi:MAG: hypothetical protein QXT06_05175 [Candidatus Bathyarchaeia archaeon]|nr:hypothetical protein [Candidatus Bathyarchaeota archaeon]
MGERLKIFAFVAFLGFILGIVADVTATYVLPALIELLPSLGTATRFIISGLAGACLTLIVVSIWAYATSSER